MIGYRIKLAPDDNGTVLVTCPALPEVTTFGEDEVDALRRAVGRDRGSAGGPDD
jgi:antitoxin HicB